MQITLMHKVRMNFVYHMNVIGTEYDEIQRNM